MAITMHINLDIKRRLFDQCRECLHERQTLMERNIKEAQSEANAHVGAMGSRYDTFKEEAQMSRDGYAIELDKTIRLLNFMDRIRLRNSDSISVGSVVTLCDQQSGKSIFLFMFAHVCDGRLEVEGRTYMSISLASPFGQCLEGKREGDSIFFRGKEFVVAEVF